MDYFVIQRFVTFLQVHQMAVSLFRLIGSIGRNMVVTNTLGSFSLLIVFVLGGFIIAKRDIHPWWIWAYWISPLRHACGLRHKAYHVFAKYSAVYGTGLQRSMLSPAIFKSVVRLGMQLCSERAGRQRVPRAALADCALPPARCAACHECTCCAAALHHPVLCRPARATIPV